MSAPESQDEKQRRSPATLVAIAGAAAVWLVAAGPPGDQTMATWIGRLAFHLVAAVLMRWLWVRVQKPRPRILSPSLFLIAAGVALLGRFGPDTVESAGGPPMSSRIEAPPV